MHRISKGWPRSTGIGATRIQARRTYYGKILARHKIRMK